MKKRTAIIGALVSLLPLGQPLVIGTGTVLTSAAVMLSVPEKAQAESAAFYYNRGIDKHEAGDYYGAISDYNKAIEINPRDAEAYNNRGDAKADLKDFYGAIADFNKAIEINPRDAKAYNNRAQTKYMLGDMKGSCSDAKKAASLGSEESKRILSGSIGSEICGSSRN